MHIGMPFLTKVDIRQKKSEFFSVDIKRKHPRDVGYSPKNNDFLHLVLDIAKQHFDITNCKTYQFATIFVLEISRQER